MSDEHRLILGDCLDPVTGLASLPDKSVAHTICDPPFEAEAHTLQRRAKQPGWRSTSGWTDGRSVLEVPLPFAAITQRERELAAREIARITARWGLVFCQIEASHLWRTALETAGMVYRRTCLWIKPDGQPQLSGDRPGMGYETMVLCHAPGASRWNGGGRHGVYVIPKASGSEARTGHPTQKPSDVMDALLKDFTDPGELVCDPFAGSGTTGVACKRLGRRFIGWEKDPRFHAAAVKRIDAARQQYELLPRGPKPKQVKMVLP